jgi:hypothetical protein
MPKFANCAGGCGTRIRTGKGYNTSGVCRACQQAAADLDARAERRLGLVEREGVPRPSRESVTETPTTRVVEKTVSRRVKSLEDLVRECEIDTEVWNIDKWTCGKHETAMKLEDRRERDGKVQILSSTPHVEESFAVKAWLSRKGRHELAMKALFAGLLHDIRREVSAAPSGLAVPRQSVDGGFLFEFAPFDLHMGKYTWADETVTNYDVDIAEDLFNQSLEFLLDRAMRLTGGRIERVLCVFGNDVSHADNKRGTTTAGTPLDVDSRFPRVYRRICAVHRRAIDRLLGVANVDVQVVPGNHDELTSFHLGELLAARYDGDPRVRVFNSPRPRTYYAWGVNLWGFTHGDSERVSELPLAMAREVPDLWARCPSREFHIGHKHISEKFEAGGGRGRVSRVDADRPGAVEQDFHSDKGVRIRRLTSLSGHDYWHTKHAYMDRRACEAFVFHKDAGFTSHLSFNVDHFTGKAVSTR